jgi:hypothetical protein
MAKRALITDYRSGWIALAELLLEKYEVFGMQ